MVGQWPRHSRVIGKKFEPYALAIGQVALAWNDLHEVLGTLYNHAICGVDDLANTLKVAATWGTVTSDRQKRLLLDAAINHLGMATHQAFPQLAKDVLWVLGRANSLEDKRNNVIHSPLTEMMGGLTAGIFNIQVGDVYPGGILNDRANKLMSATSKRGRSLLAEIILYRDYASTLAEFGREIGTAWRVRSPWPDRPELPPLKDKA